jgi:hypothetical protein
MSPDFYFWIYCSFAERAVTKVRISRLLSNFKFVKTQP